MKHVNEASCPWLGHSNKLPPNFEEVSSDEFWSWFSYHYHICAWALRYIVNEPKQHSLYGKSLTMFIDLQKRNGYGFSKEVENAKGVTPKLYFKFYDCDHSMKLYTNLGNCLNQYKCEKCGFSETIDSSD